MIGLGLDGGGSATRWRLSDETGARLAAGEAPAVSGHLFAPAERARFAAALDALRRALPAGAPVEAIVAGVTGLAAGTAEADAAEALLAETFALPRHRVAVGDDMWIAYRALFAPGEGHVVAAGSGSIGYHLGADGRAIRVGGRGMLLDDGGSAFWIAREALRLLLRRADTDPASGRRGLLAEAVYGAVGGAAWSTVRAFVYGGDRGRIAALARPVADAAAAGDADALAILEAAGRELARLAAALVARAGPKPVALIGRAAALHPAIADSCRSALPDLAWRLASPDAAAAAAALAARGTERPPPLED